LDPNELAKEFNYTAIRLAGPSKNVVSLSTITIAASLAAYLESPLLYSFPIILGKNSRKLCVLINNLIKWFCINYSYNKN